MSDKSYLDWPFFEERHRKLERELDAWAAANLARSSRERRRRRLPHAVRQARGGRLAAPRGRRHRLRRRVRRDRHARDLPDPRDAGAPLRPRRFRLRHAGPGLGRDHPLRHARSRNARYLPRVASRRGDRGVRPLRAGRRIGRGGDQLRARREDGDAYVLNGEKTWISNGGIADFYVVFARTGEGQGSARHLGLHRRCRHPGLRASPSAST